MVEIPHSFKSAKYNLLSIETLHDMIPGYLTDLSFPTMLPFSNCSPATVALFEHTKVSALAIFPLPRMPPPATHKALILTSFRCLLKCHLPREAFLNNLSKIVPSSSLHSLSHTHTYINTHYQGRDFIRFFHHSSPSTQQELKEYLLNTK